MPTTAAIEDPRERLAAAIERVAALRRRVDDLERAEASSMSLRIEARRSRDDRRGDLEHARRSEGALLVDAVINGGVATSPVADAEMALHRAGYQYEQALKASQSVGAELERSRTELAWQTSRLGEAVMTVVAGSEELAALREAHRASLERLQAAEAVFRYLRSRGGSDALLRAPSGVVEHDADPMLLQRWVSWLTALAADAEAAFPEVH